MLYDGISAVKDGNTTHDIVDQWPDSPQYWGFDSWLDVQPYAFGHGIGLTLHDPPIISPVARSVGFPAVKIREGMILALETWTGKRGCKDGVRLEENVLVTKDGCEVISKFPIDNLIECWI